MGLPHTGLIQNIFCCYESQLRSTALPLKQLKAIDAIVNCRSERGGYSVYRCPKEQSLVTHYHSCRHRSCWLCAFKQREVWIEKQRQRLLNCPHFHRVFTLPHEYLNLWRYNQRWFTAALFTCVRETLTELMSDKRYYGITPGMIMALHTWGRQLTLHPHIHCLITAGGLGDRQNWRETGEYLLPIQVVKRLYRGKMQGKIKKALCASELTLPPNQSKRDVDSIYQSTYAKPWSVRIEQRYNTGRGVMLYLSRYLKGGPINPRQIKRCDSDRIELSYKDHRDKRSKVLSLKPREFLKRLLSHVPEIGQHGVRHYGLYSSASRDKRNVCRQIIGGIEEPIQTQPEKPLVTCGSCGTELKHVYSSRPQSKKGNSNIKPDARFFVQQYVEAYLGIFQRPIRSEAMRV